MFPMDRDPAVHQQTRQSRIVILETAMPTFSEFIIDMQHF